MLTTRLIHFDSIGSSVLGYLSVAQSFEKIPFQIQRVYWTYFTPQSVERGGHANINKEMVLVAVAGTITVSVETIEGYINTYVLDKPDVGLYIPALCWHTMKYSHSAVQLVIASNDYDPLDYIRDYDEFKRRRTHP